MLKITGLYIYPVKSMKGIAIEEAQLTPTGLRHDRHWMVVRPNGRFVTQRDIPKMSLVHTRLDENGMVLSMSGHGSISVPFELFDGKPVATRVWDDACESIDQGDDVSAWLTQALPGREPLRLVRMNPECTRPLKKVAFLGEKTTTEFADAAPYLVANEASLEALNSVLKSSSLNSVPMNRFRPNIVVQGLESFTEHQVAELSAENYQLKLCFPCKRCIVITINQDTAEKNTHKQPFKTLQTLNPIPDDKKAPAFGENATLTLGNQQLISVGDHLEATFK